MATRITTKIFRDALIFDELAFCGKATFKLNTARILFRNPGSIISNPKMIKTLPATFSGVISSGSVSKTLDNTGEINIAITISDEKISDVFSGVT